MFSISELRQIDKNYFEVHDATAYQVTVKSRCTGHFWHMLSREYNGKTSVVIYHKHHSYDEYHMHGNAWTLEKAFAAIRRHDSYQQSVGCSIGRQNDSEKGVILWKKCKKNSSV